MTNEEKLAKIKEWEHKKSAFELIMSTCYFDLRTIAPKDGAKYRNDRLSKIEEVYYDIANDSKIKALVYELANVDLGCKNNRYISLYKKEFKIYDDIPKNLYLDFQRDCLDSMDAWEIAKEKDDYRIFEPHLKKMIDYRKRMAEYRSTNGNIYDVLLDDYEEGMNIEKYDKFFNKLKDALLPLIAKITESNAIDDGVIHHYYSADKQAILMNDINKYLGFTSNWGYMGVSMHPFTNGFSNNDVRVTTLYDEYNISSSIFSIVHEVGHAFYEHQTDEKYDGTIIKKAISSGMHESQSRLFENYLGRSESFITNFYPKMQELFPEELKEISLKEFTKMINVSKPSFIRTDADELTYPIHILIRYEIEKGLMNGSISSENLDITWEDMYEKYLGIRPKTKREGILQDIHWSDASFGYFPTYALGSAVAAQIYRCMKKEINVKEALESNFKMITDWLKENVQKYAALYELDEILLKATGEKFNPDYYIEYLVEKYSKLYNL